MDHALRRGQAQANSCRTSSSAAAVLLFVQGGCSAAARAGHWCEESDIDSMFIDSMFFDDAADHKDLTQEFAELSSRLANAKPV